MDCRSAFTPAFFDVRHKHAEQRDAGIHVQFVAAASLRQSSAAFRAQSTDAGAGPGRGFDDTPPASVRRVPGDGQ